MATITKIISGDNISHSIVSDITPDDIGASLYKNQVISQFITQALSFVKSGIITNMAAKGKNASRLTVRSLKVVRDTPQSGFIASSSRGLAYTQNGRGAGKIPSNFEAIIRRWILDKGISVKHITIKNPKRARLTPEQRDIRAAAHNIARSIRRKGTLQRRKGWTNIYSHEISQAKVWLHRRVAQETLLSVRKFILK